MLPPVTLALTFWLALQRPVDRFTRAVDDAARLDKELSALVRRALAESAERDPESALRARAALAFLPADVKRAEFNRALYFGPDRARRFVIDEIARARDASQTEGLVHVAVAAAGADDRAAAFSALRAVNEPRTAEVLMGHVKDRTSATKADRALEVLAYFPDRANAATLIAELRSLNKTVAEAERAREENARQGVAAQLLDAKYAELVETQKARRSRVHAAIVAIAGENVGGYEPDAWEAWLRK